MIEAYKFTKSELEFAAQFARKAGLTVSSVPHIDTCEQEDDTLVIGFFAIQKIEGVREYTSLRGTITSPELKFVVTTETRTFSNTWGEDREMVEISTEASLFDALKACALAEKEWELNNLLESICIDKQLEDEV